VITRAGGDYTALACFHPDGIEPVCDLELSHALTSDCHHFQQKIADPIFVLI